MILFSKLYKKGRDVFFWWTLYFSLKIVGGRNFYTFFPFNKCRKKNIIKFYYKFIKVFSSAESSNALFHKYIYKQTQRCHREKIIPVSFQGLKTMQALRAALAGSDEVLQAVSAVAKNNLSINTRLQPLLPLFLQISIFNQHKAISSRANKSRKSIQRYKDPWHTTA